MSKRRQAGTCEGNREYGSTIADQNQAPIYRTCAAWIKNNRNIDALCRIQVNRCGYTRAEPGADQGVLRDGKSNISRVGYLYRLRCRRIQCLRTNAKAAWR